MKGLRTESGGSSNEEGKDDGKLHGEEIIAVRNMMQRISSRFDSSEGRFHHFVRFSIFSNEGRNSITKQQKPSPAIRNFTQNKPS